MSLNSHSNLQADNTDVLSITLSFHSKHDKEKQKLCFMFSLTETPGEFKGLQAATVWPSAAEQQPTTLRRPQGLKRQPWPIYGCLTFFPSRPCFSFPTHLSFPYRGNPHHPPLKPLNNPTMTSLSAPAFSPQSLCFTDQPQNFFDCSSFDDVCFCPNINMIIRYEPCKFTLWIRCYRGFVMSGQSG